jgi:ATP-dependent RNA helicase RhlE
MKISVSFNDLGLSAELLRAVSEQGYTEATPIQAQAIPVVLAGKDLLAAAQTGTGKTAGFTLPMLQRLSQAANSVKNSASASPARHPVRALVLVPTRELAAQVQDSVRAYGRHLRLRSTVVFGGVSINNQISDLRRGVDIVVATPGRLLDHVGQKTIDLRHVEILVLDEADRMLDMGFIPDIRRIIALLPKQRQNLLFSATFSDEIRKLANAFLRDPVSVEVARRNLPVELITQLVHPTGKDNKRALLSHLVKSQDWGQVLVFTKTKHGANRLAEQLGRDGIEADAIHGNKTQGARTRTLARFKKNELRVLVATDIAARGLDIDQLPHVVNYDLPNVPEDYVHRIGRTGRAGASGIALSLVCHEDRPLLAAIERLINRRIPQELVVGFEPGKPGPRDEPMDDRRNERRAQRPGRPAQPRKQAQRPQQHRDPRQDPRRARDTDRRRDEPRQSEPRAGQAAQSPRPATGRPAARTEGTGALLRPPRKAA